MKTVLQLFWFNKITSFQTCTCHGHDGMIVGFTTTCAISAYHHNSYEFEPSSWQGVLDTFCDQVCQ